MSGWGARRGLMAVLGAVVVCVVIALVAGTAVVMSHSSAKAKGNEARTAADSSKRPGPFRVVSVTPSGTSAGVNGAAPVKVVFSGPVASGSPMPKLHPAVPGSWQVSGDTAEFTAQRGYGEQTRVRLTIPGGSGGVTETGGEHLAQPMTVRYKTGSYSSTRLAQVLAQLGYLPLTWTASGPASAAGASLSGTTELAQRSAAFAPPAGSFAWHSGYPSRLHRLWHGGAPASMVIQGAVRAFESDEGLAMDGIAGPQVWRDLFSAAAQDKLNSHGYTYAVADQSSSPETLTVWHNGRQIFRNDANTGIPGDLTAVGTFPVYLKYTFQIMRGTNPDGTKYADPVSWVSYFNAGMAVHYFGRYSYGSQQSLGCVELPYSPAKFIWPYLTYGTLVTVTPL